MLAWPARQTPRKGQASGVPIRSVPGKGTRPRPLSAASLRQAGAEHHRDWQHLVVGDAARAARVAARRVKKKRRLSDYQSRLPAHPRSVAEVGHGGTPPHAAAEHRALWRLSRGLGAP